ncbi:MAG: pyruvate formate-lyase-activating protein [Clostridiales bacterium]
MSLTGNIHSFESFGTLDGPGIRFVIFLQGCNFKCIYCHNPDTWNFNKNNIYTTKELINIISKYIPYFKSSTGGITISGGEPFLQIDFVIDLLKECKKINIHTAIDTNGYLNVFSNEYSNTPEKFNYLLDYTDLFLVDIKHMDKNKHIDLTGKDNDSVLKFINYLDIKNKPFWIRYVIVPGYTDSSQDLKKLSQYIKTFKNIKKIELLPFNKVGEYKWKHLKYTYLLKNVKEPTKKYIQNLERQIYSNI